MRGANGTLHLVAPPTPGAPPPTAGLRLRLVLLVLLAALPGLFVAAIVVFDDGSGAGFGGILVACVASVVLAAYLAELIIVRPLRSSSRGDAGSDELNRLRTDFVSMASHDLRNPLATIRGFGQLLRDRPRSMNAAQQRRAADAIVRQVDRMALLVDNVLDVARLESGTFTYAFVNYDPEALISAVVTEARASWPRHDIDVRIDGTLPGAKGDADRLKQVVMNLLSNACRFSAEGTTVTVRGGSDGQALRIDVIDRGSGVPPESAQVLFERMARVRTPDAQRVRGSGLGLYISRRIVEAHGGRIWFESPPGAGSIFSVELPLDPAGRAN